MKRLSRLFVLVWLAILLVGAVLFSYRAYNILSERDRLADVYTQLARTAQRSLTSSIEERFALVRLVLAGISLGTGETVDRLTALGTLIPRFRDNPLFRALGRMDPASGTIKMFSNIKLNPEEQRRILDDCAALPKASGLNVNILPPIRVADVSEWLLPFVMPNILTGTCDGAVALVRNQFINEFLIELGVDFALLTLTDGTILARYPEGGTQTGRSLGQSSVFATAWRNSPSGELISVSPVDGRKRINAYSSLPDFPVIVASGFDYARVSDAIDRELKVYYSELATTSAVLLALFALTYVLMAGYRTSWSKAEQSELELQERWQFFAGSTNQSLWEADLGGGQIRLSRRIVKMIEGIDQPVSIALASWRERVHPDDLAAAEIMFAGTESAEPTSAPKFRLRFSDGSWHWMQVSSVVTVRARTGEPERVIGMLADITSDEEVRIQGQLINTVFAEAAEAILITDAENRIVVVNRAFTRVTGYEAADVIGHTPSMLRSGRHDADFYRAMWEELVSTGHWQGEIWNRRRDGEVYPEWLGISVIRDEAGRIVRYVGIFSDITERKASEQRIHHLAHYDHLTHLPNRLLLRDRIQQLMKTIDRTERKVALLFIDLDQFKRVNDSMGHAAGDKLLIEVAERLTRTVRRSDTVSRLGGDEFVILMPEIKSHNDAAAIAGKVIAAVQRPITIDKQEVQVSCSIGIALFPDDGWDFDLLLRNADMSMYQAKREGRARYYFYTETLNRQAEERMRIESAMRRGLEAEEFFLVYQPQFGIDGEKVIGFEALLRWHHPKDGLVSPSRFIPLAEETGLIIPLGEFAFRRACRQVREWRSRGFDVPVVGVNVSALQFGTTDFLERLRTIMSEERAEGRWFDLEITESALMAPSHVVEHCVGVLKELGFRMSIDDFGTGYSSMLYLKRFQVDRIKIDQGFTRSLEADASKAAICGAIINMSASLGLATIAEGVETEEERLFLQQLGCHQMQGYLKSRPVPAAEAEILMSQQGFFGGQSTA